MSFTKNLKAQLCHGDNNCHLCNAAELSAMLRLSTSYQDKTVTISTENEDVAERMQVLFEKVFKKQIDYVNRNGSFRFHPDFDFFSGELAERLGFFEPNTSKIAPKECCRSAYLRGDSI